MSGGEGYKRDGKKAVVPQCKRRELDGDEKGMFNRLHKTASDALMTMIRAKRLYFRRQYDGDEQDQSLMRSARRKVQAERAGEGGAHPVMEQAQYRVLERITSKEELQSALARPAFEKSKAKKEALLTEGSAVDQVCWLPTGGSAEEVLVLRGGGANRLM
jgi:hypothetical protein